MDDDTQALPNAVKEEPVGLLIFLSEAVYVHPEHESVKLRSAMTEARSRISAWEGLKQKEELKTKRAEVSMVAVTDTVELKDPEDDSKSFLYMKDGKLQWTIKNKQSKEVAQITGPLCWNHCTGKMSGCVGEDEWEWKPDDAGMKALKQHWVLSEMPVNAENARAKAAELKAAVEAAGRLVDGCASSSAQQALFRLLGLDVQEDKEEWEGLDIKMGMSSLPGILDAYYAGQVKISNGPGYPMIEDKELGAHVGKLIQHYLGEEPILRTIPTLSFASDPGLLHSVFDDPRTQGNVVVKRVDGRGGDAVWVGAKLPRAEFLAARPLVAGEPEAFIVQKYTALSQVDEQLVDLRGPAFITSSGTIFSGGPGVGVSPVMWGRGLASKGCNGKVNISDAGFEFAIAIASDA